MTWRDFWSQVFPAYLGAVGSIAASAVAVAAFIRDLRTRKGLKEVAESSAPSVEIQTGGPSGEERVPSSAPSIGARRGDNISGAEPRLELETRGKQSVLRNAGPEPIAITEVSIPSGSKRLTLPVGLPARVEPGEEYGFVVGELLGGAAVAALQVRWADSAGVIRVSRFFV